MKPMESAAKAGRRVFFFTGEGKSLPSIRQRRAKGKVAGSLEEAFRLAEIKDGMTISFHHHLRNGDLVVNMALDVLAGWESRPYPRAVRPVSGARGYSPPREIRWYGP